MKYYKNVVIKVQKMKLLPKVYLNENFYEQNKLVIPYFLHYIQLQTYKIKA